MINACVCVWVCDVRIYKRYLYAVFLAVRLPPTKVLSLSRTLLKHQVHSFTCGFTIGAAFLGCGSTMGWTILASTVIHEVPAEIADFIALLNGGMSIKQVGLACSLVVNRSAGCCCCRERFVLRTYCVLSSFPPRRAHSLCTLAWSLSSYISPTSATYVYDTPTAVHVAALRVSSW